MRFDQEKIRLTQYAGAAGEEAPEYAAMAEAGDVSLEFEIAAIPEPPRALHYIDAGFLYRGARVYGQGSAAKISGTEKFNFPQLQLLHDPQTSGPFRMTLPEDRVVTALQALKAAGYSRASTMGEAGGPSGVSLKLR